MSTIRRQSIISSIVVYFGFALGFFNTWLFAREGGFSKEQYGLTATFIAIASIMFSVAGLGMNAYISKFFPYYRAHLPPKKNDQLTWALLLPCIGFLLVILLTISLKDVLVNRIFNNSPELVTYFYWILPFAFGYTLFMVMESFAWMTGKAVLSNFLKEVLFRFFVTVLVLLTTWHVIRDFDTFIRIYAFMYLVIVLILVAIFYRRKQLHFTFSVSKVTRRFRSKIITLASFIWAGGLVFNIAGVFDTIVIAAVLPNGMAAVAPFTLAQNISSLIQAPQRAIVSASVGPLSHAWKEKNYEQINRIYHRSSINQLIFSTAMFSLIWLNFEDGVYTFNLQKDYLAAMPVFLFIGLTRVIDMGTGVNAQIIGTSTFWRFEFISGIILLAVSLPLNYVLARHLGIVGPAISNLVAFTVYNGIRYIFLWRRFNMQPFTWKSLYTLVVAAAVFLVCYLLFDGMFGLTWMMLRSFLFLLLFGTAVVMLKLTPDLQPVLQTVKKRLRIGN
jgi:O-antigen/teichoic acid export membrane protein